MITEEQRLELIRLLQQGEELSPEWGRILFPPDKREYELVYHGKDREEDILASTLAVPLQAVRTFGVNGSNGDWRNMLIFGDNLQAMKSLVEMKKARTLCNADGSPGARLIYIDPPFASKREFEGGQDQKAYQDKLIGVRFLDFLRSRLIFMRELLADDGHIFVHVDYRKGHYVKALLDEVFQEGNFRNEIILPGRASKNLQQQFVAISRLNVRHDNLFWYSAAAGSKVAPLWIEKHNKGNPEGHWHHFWSTADRPTMRYELFGIKPETGQWTWETERAFRAVDNYNRFLEEAGGRTLAEYWRDTGSSLEFVRKNPDDGSPQYWRAPASERLADTVWSGIPIYSNSTKYPTEKNERLLHQIVDFVTSTGDLVMDAFAGSGTACVMAEKLGRRWVGIDCGKLAIYTMQKRLLNLRKEIGNKGQKLQAKPFVLFNAGLYDFSRLRELPWESWRFFALQLFQCRDEQHRINGVPLDGYLKGASVLVFNHMNEKGVRIDEDTVLSLHEALGSRVGSKLFIIAPALTFDFQRDYIDVAGVRYYALRIPYSIIRELHQREFTALKQPADETAVNDTVEAVGFDFIRTPELDFECARGKREGELFKEGIIRIKTFKSEAVVREPLRKKNNYATLSMVMLDYDFDDKGQVFELDAVHYADSLKDQNWEVRFPLDQLGKKMMAVFIDIYGNEARVLIEAERFGVARRNGASRDTGERTRRKRRTAKAKAR